MASTLKKEVSNVNKPQHDSLPLPGSDEAVKAGCTCPVMDNRHGKGMWQSQDGRALFVITGGCPLHGVPRNEEASK